MDSDSRTYKNSRRRSVNKKVSFSIMGGGITFDEIAEMRKLKEKELDNFIENKKKTNQFISSLKYNNISLPSNNNTINIKKNEEDKNVIFNNKNNNINNNSSINSSGINIHININNKKKNNNCKNTIPLRHYLTDEEEEENKISGTFMSQNKLNTNLKKDEINENDLDKFTQTISDIFYSKNNRNKKNEIKKNIFKTLKSYNEALIQYNYLDDEDKDIEHKTFLENKKIFFIRNKTYENFIQKIKDIRYKKLINKKNNEEAYKFYNYTLYKKKVLAFDALKNYAIKQKIWIQSIQAGLKKELIWSCIDSWKLYVNYKKIKKFLKLRKTKVIFDALRNNKQLSINLLKQGKKMSLILEYRHFFNNVRKSILAEKAKEINYKLLNEFRRQNLMKNLFNVLKENHRNEKEKENKFRKMFLTKYEDKDFINIKIFCSETYKINNQFSIKQVQNKIQI
jgi:hypothetical protein